MPTCLLHLLECLVACKPELPENKRDYDEEACGNWRWKNFPQLQTNDMNFISFNTFVRPDKLW